MIISVSNSFTHKVPTSNKINNNSELERKVMDGLQKLGLSSEDIKKNEEGHLEIPANLDRIKLHTLMLQMENLGMDLKMTKKTLIEIS